MVIAESELGWLMIYMMMSVTELTMILQQLEGLEALSRVNRRRKKD